MKYAYENLSPKQFENLIILLCQRLLGIAVQGFSEGPDGGRDAKFVGVAEAHPSKAAPWSGTVIIQAKHTNGYNRHFSESDFFNQNSSTTTIAQEIPRILKLRKEKHLDHYMLFANRRLAGNAETDLQQHLSKECGLPIGSVFLCGIEQLELFFKAFPDIPKIAELDPVDSPLIVSPDDLSVVVQAFAKHRDVMKDVLDNPPMPRVPYTTKNKINNMTEEYAKGLRKRFLKETIQIKTFLAAPENLALLKMYETVVDEFQLKIIAKRKDYQTFDAVMEYLVDLLFARDAILSQTKHKRLTRAMLFYMYWNCDIGETDNAETE